MHIQFLGASRNTSGSQYLLEVNDYKILLDCGFFLGLDEPELAYYQNRHFNFKPSEVDVLILSHAHIDHSGNIPRLVKEGFHGDIICHYATRDLCTISLTEHARSLETRAVSKNKLRRNRTEIIKPIFTIADAIESIKFMVGIAYERPYTILPGIYLTLYDAGHMMGSAIIALDIEDKKLKKDIRLVYSGDLGRFAENAILKSPTIIHEANILLIESTYGSKHHNYDSINPTDNLMEVAINETVRRGGKAIIATSPIGMAQQIVYQINRLLNTRNISPNIPVYLDSPLAIDATAIYRLHPETFNERVAEFMLESDGGDPFQFKSMHYTRSINASKELNFLETPAIIISAGRTANYGRVLYHVRNAIEDPRNSIILIGPQPPNTIGSNLLERKKEINIFKEDYLIRAQVFQFFGASGHADQRDLLKWISGFKKPIERIFVVHGNKPGIFRFARTLQNQGFSRVAVPYLGQSFKV